MYRHAHIHTYKQTRRACELRKAVLAFDSDSDSDADSDSDSELKTLSSECLFVAVAFVVVQPTE